MTANFPVSIVTHGLGLNVTIQSYNGSLDYGLIACKRTVPTLRLFADAMLAAHQELLDLVHADAAMKVSTLPVAKPATKLKSTRVAKSAAKPPAREKVKPKVAVGKLISSKVKAKNSHA